MTPRTATQTRWETSARLPPLAALASVYFRLLPFTIAFKGTLGGLANVSEVHYATMGLLFLFARTKTLNLSPHVPASYSSLHHSNHITSLFQSLGVTKIWSRVARHYCTHDHAHNKVEKKGEPFHCHETSVAQWLQLVSPLVIPC